MRNVTAVLGATLLAASAGVLAGPATSLAEPAPSTDSSAESPAPTQNAAEPSEESPKPADDTPKPAGETPKKSTTGGHEVTYTITATSDLTGNISYIKTDPPSMAAYNANSSEYLETVRVPIGGGQPLVYTATLADPGQWALVTASGGLRINPEFRCEIAVDGDVVVSQQGGSGVTCSTRPW
ncbi:hypothetical protein [Mycolicibacter senuensis]|uniref:hypothetical protein n=1 Tax=Mycolicibacter senuensis TaxID=386913 RepID=UPI000A15EBFF|nr:hypothetical protein [Mycolicibacter senuensis]ORW65814.1 hypothetical protein AWC24_18700 [Mycolicibacter senuensis]